MRRKMTAATQSKISVKELNPFSDEAQLETLLCEALFENDKERFEKFVSEQMVILDKLRRALYHIGQKKPMDEVSELQPYATLFLENFLMELNLDAQVLQGQEMIFKLKGEVYIADKTNAPVLKSVAGFADLLVLASQDEPVSQAHLVVELKAPNLKSGLYHSSAGAPKDQLIFEMELVAQMSDPNRASVMGLLTDMVAAAAIMRISDGDVVTFYVSPRVTNTRHFILCLILQMCGDEDKDFVWKQLLPLSTDEAEEDDAEEEGEEEEGEGEVGDGEMGESGAKDADANDDNEGSFRPVQHRGKENVFRGVASGGSTLSSFAREAAVALKLSKDEERRADKQAAVSRLLSWDNSRRGLATLTSDALNKLIALRSGK